MPTAIDKEINRLDHYCKQMKKLRNIMNTIKANGLYSEKEMQRDLEALETFNAPQGESDVISNGWYIRKQMNNKLIKEANKLLKQIKKELKKDEHKKT